MEKLKQIESWDELIEFIKKRLNELRTEDKRGSYEKQFN